jgi:hypothetical protein
MKTILKLFKRLLNAILSLFKGKQKNKKNKPQPTYKVAYINYLCQKLKDMANTGKQLCYQWSYKEDGQTISTCQLIKNMSGATPVFYTAQEAQLLTDVQYAAAFSATRDYMQNALGWTVLPMLADSNKINFTDCPIGSGNDYMIANLIIRFDLSLVAEQISGTATVLIGLVADGIEYAANVQFNAASPYSNIIFNEFAFNVGSQVVGVRVDSPVGGIVDFLNKNGQTLITGGNHEPMFFAPPSMLSALYENGEIELKVRIR